MRQSDSRVLFKILKYSWQLKCKYKLFAPMPGKSLFWSSLYDLETIYSGHGYKAVLFTVKKVKPQNDLIEQ